MPSGNCSMAYRDRYDLEPLHITAHLRTGVVCDRWLPLDGILLYQACRDALGPQTVTIPGGQAMQGVGTLPLGIVHPGRCNWYYQCSWAQPQPWWAGEGQDHWNKRFDQGFAYLVDFQGRRGKVIIEQGRYKAYHMPLFYYATRQVEWYCIGDRTEIEYLLSTVTHLGKKASQGWGRVSRWQVEPRAEDLSVWRDDSLTRGIPVEDWQAVKGRETFDLMHYGIRPSYYRHENQMPLVKPNG